MVAASNPSTVCVRNAIGSARAPRPNQLVDDDSLESSAANAAAELARLPGIGGGSVASGSSNGGTPSGRNGIIMMETPSSASPEEGEQQNPLMGRGDDDDDEGMDDNGASGD